MDGPTPGGALTLLLLAWTLSTAVVLGAHGGGPMGAGSVLAAAALPWLALSGLPRRGGGSGAGSSVALALGLAAPTIALAAALRHRAGTGAGAVVLEAGTAAALIAGLSLAAALAAGTPGGSAARARHGSLWLVLVVGLPLLAAVVGWNDAPGGAGWLDTAARVSPLHWAFDRAAGGVPAATGGLAPAATVLVLLGAARGARA